MLNGHTNLIADGARHSLLSWTVEDPALESWVFVNGVKLYGPLLLETLGRSVPVPLRADNCLTVEVHDMPPEGIATPVFETTTTTPVIQWNPLPGAQRYRLYHWEGSGTERRVFDRPSTDYRGTPISIDAPLEMNGLGGVWHFLRVEAVDEYGNESTRRAWRFFAQELPRLPSRIEIAAGASPGLFTITVTQ